MSPEQATGDQHVGPATDIYALGCVLYEMLAGEPPYTASSHQALLAKKLSEPVPHISVVRETVPASIEAALNKALARNAVDRFKTAAEFSAALTVAPPPPRGRGRRVAMVAVVAVAMVAAVATWQYGMMADPGPPVEDRPFTVLAAIEGGADPAAKDAIAFALRTGLDWSHVVQTVQPIDVEHELGLMERPETTVLDLATARELAQRLGVPTVVVPRLDHIADSYMLVLRVEDVATKQLRAEAGGSQREGETVVEMVARVLEDLRRGLGESRAALANTGRLPQVLTPSLEALKKYRVADSLFLQNSASPQAEAALREAVALDTAFAMAWRKLV